MIGDALHNVGDGILLTSAFVISPVIGLIAMVSIFVHELVQEVSEFFVLRQAGFSARKALALNFLVSATILIGSLGGYILLEAFEVIELPLLGIAAGSFIVVVIYDLIPHSVRHSKKQTKYGKHLAWFLVGLVLMFSIGLIAGHPEGDDGHTDDNHDSDPYEYEMIS